MRKTYLENFESQINDTIKAILEFQVKGASEEVLRSHNVIMGSQLELFLKKSVFTHPLSSLNLFSLIKELHTVGIHSDLITKLQIVRKSYNSSKHNPHYKLTISQTNSNAQTLKSFILEIQKIKNLDVNKLMPLTLITTFWGFAWDHYIGGDTEISIFIPSMNDNPFSIPSIDTIYIKMDSWKDFQKDIVTHGHFSTDPNDIINSKLYDAMKKEGDFLSGFTFEGRFQDLIRTLSKYELRQELIPGLNRSDNSYVILQSLAISAIEAIKTFSTKPKEETLKKRIRGMGENRYAVPKDYKHTEYFLGIIANLLSSIEFDKWILIEGPIWSDVKLRQSQDQEALFNNPNIVLTKEYIINLYF